LLDIPPERLQNLHTLGKTKWVTRVPWSIKKAKDILENVKEPEFQASEHQGYKYQEKQVSYHGIKQRWLIVESEKRKESDEQKLDQKIIKEREKIEKQLEKWQKIKTNNLPELKLEVKQFNQKLKYHQIESIKYLKNLNKQKEEVYSCQGKIAEKSEVIQGETQRAGRFILATNVLVTVELPAEKM
jgi:transposase